MSFRSFVNYLSKTDLHTCDPHYAFQKKWFEDVIPGCFNEIIKLENLEAAIDDLNSRKGFHFNLSGLTSSHHHDKNKELTENVSDLKWSRFKDNIPAYSNFYDADLVEKVYTLYQKDFEAYGYLRGEI
jgi:hypothetical protein